MACCGRVSLLSLIWSALTVLVRSALLEKCRCLSLDQGWYVEVGSWHPLQRLFRCFRGKFWPHLDRPFLGSIVAFYSPIWNMSHVLLFWDSLSSLSLEFGLLYRILQLPSWRMILIRSVAPKLAWQQDQHRWFHVQNQETDDSQKRSHQYQDTRTKNYWDLRQTDRVRVGICWFSFPWLVAWQFQNVSKLYWLAGQYRSLCENKVDTTCVKCSAQSKETTERRGTSGSVVVQAYAVMSGTVSRWLRNERGRNGWLLVHTLRDKHGATTGQACYWIWREMTLQGPWGTLQSTTFRNKLALSRNLLSPWK